MTCTYYRKTQIGDFEIEEVRPPRFIGRDGVRELSSVTSDDPNKSKLSFLDYNALLYFKSYWYSPTPGKSVIHDWVLMSSKFLVYSLFDFYHTIQLYAWRFMCLIEGFHTNEFVCVCVGGRESE